LNFRRDGIRAYFGPTLGSVPVRMQAIVVPDETHFLNALKGSLDIGKVPADELLNRYHGEWIGDPTRIYGEYSY